MTCSATSVALPCWVAHCITRVAMVWVDYLRGALTIFMSFFGIGDEANSNPFVTTSSADMYQSASALRVRFDSAHRLRAFTKLLAR